MKISEDKVWKSNTQELIKNCYCVGPQNNEPLCPCRMREVVIIPEDISTSKDFINCVKNVS